MRRVSPSALESTVSVWCGGTASSAKAAREPLPGIATARMSNQPAAAKRRRIVDCPHAQVRVRMSAPSRASGIRYFRRPVSAVLTPSPR